MNITMDGNITAGGNIFKIDDSKIREILSKIRGITFGTFNYNNGILKLKMNPIEYQKAFISYKDMSELEFSDGMIIIRGYVQPEPMKFDTKENTNDQDSNEKSNDIKTLVINNKKIKSLNPGKYKVKLENVTFAILIQNKEKQYLKDGQIVEINENFNRITGVNTNRRG